MLHGVAAFRAGHAKAAPAGLTDGKDEIANPCHRQIGQHRIIGAQPIEFARRLRGHDDVVIRQHDTLRPACCTGRIKHRAGIRPGLTGQPRVKNRLQRCFILAATRLQFFIVCQAGAVIFAHAARIQKDNLFNTRQLVLNLDDLVDLFLILRHDKAGRAMINHIGHFLCHSILIERHRNGPYGLCGNHRPIEIGPVPANDRDMIAFCQTKIQKTKCKVFDLLGRLRPAPALPDAEFFFTERRRIRANSGMMRHQTRNRIKRLINRRHHLQSSPTPAFGLFPI